MPANPTLVTLYNTNLPDNTDGEITPAKLREAFVDTAAEIDTVGDAIVASTNTALAAKASIAYVDAAVEVLQEQIDELPSGSSEEDATPTTFAGSIKYDKRNRVYTVPVSEITDPITVDSAGAAAGKGATLIIENDDDSLDEPTFTGFVVIDNGVTYDPTEGNSTAYISSYIGGVAILSRVRLGVAVAGPVALSTPSLSLTADSDAAITANWTNVANEQGYTVELATNSGFTTGLVTASKSANVTTHQFTGLSAASQYYIRVKAEGDGVSFTDSAYDSDSTFTFASGLTPLSAPTLTLTIDSTTAATASWTNVANESSYSVQIATDSGFTTAVQTASKTANTLSHQFTGLTPNTLYYARVKAVGDGVTYSDSTYGTDSDTTTALTALTAPAITLTVDSDTEITADWTNVSNESGYSVQLATNSGFTTGLVTVSKAANAITHQFTGLTASTPYYIRVKATGDGVTYSDSPYDSDTATTDAASGYSYGGITDWAFLLDASLDVATTGTDVTSWKDQVSGTVLTARGTAPVYDPVNEFMSTTPGGSAFSLPALTLPGGTSAITVIAIIAGSVYGQSVVAALGGSHLSGTPSTGGAYLMKDQPTPGSGYYSGVANGNVGYNSVDIQYDASGNFDLIRFEVDRTKASNEATIYKNPASTAGVVSLSNNNSNTFTTGLKLDIFGEWNGSAVSDSVRGAIAFFGIVPRILTSGEVSALYTQLVTDKGGLSPNF